MDAQLLMLRGLVSKMTPEQRAEVEAAEAEINQLLQGSSDLRKLGICLAVLELASAD